MHACDGEMKSFKSERVNAPEKAMALDVRNVLGGVVSNWYTMRLSFHKVKRSAGVPARQSKRREEKERQRERQGVREEVETKGAERFGQGESGDCQ